MGTESFELNKQRILFKVSMSWSTNLLIKQSTFKDSYKIKINLLVDQAIILMKMKFVLFWTYVIIILITLLKFEINISL